MAKIENAKISIFLLERVYKKCSMVYIKNRKLVVYLN